MMGGSRAFCRYTCPQRLYKKFKGVTNLINETNGNKEFEQALKSKMSWKCSCSLDTVDKKSSLRQIICKGCGTMFKTNKNSNYCLECKEIFYDEP